MSTTGLPKRRWRRLFVWSLIAVVCIWLAGLVWIHYARHRAQRRQAAILAIREAGGHAFGPRHWSSGTPRWFGRLLYHLGARDVRFPGTVHQVHFPEGEIGKEHLQLLREFPELRQLILYGTAIDDDDLAYVAKLTDLRELGLGSSQISDDGLKHLAGLLRLATLHLRFTQVCDNGVEQIEHLTNLRELNLSNTAITDDGLRLVAGLHNLRRLELGDTSVGDRGIAHLAKMSQLEELNLSGTRITGDGLNAISRLTNLKQLFLDGTAIDNDSLAALSGLTNLEVLFLGGTKVTDGGLRHLAWLYHLRNFGLNSTQLSDAAWRAVQWDGFRPLRPDGGNVRHAQQGPHPIIAAVQTGDFFRLTGAVDDTRIPPPDADVVARLPALLQHEDPPVRKLAAYALGRVAGSWPQAVSALIKTLQDDDASVRWHAAAALGRIGPSATDAVAALSVALNDEDVPVRIRAGIALWRITGRTQPAISGIVNAWREDPGAIMPITDTLAEMAPAFQDSVPALRELAAGGQGWVAWPALEVLGRMDREGVQHLMEGLDNPETRLLAAKWLGERGSEAKEAVPALVAALGDERPEVCTYIAEALGKTGVQDPAVLSALAETFEDSAGYKLRHVRKAALEALLRLAPTGEATRAAVAEARNDKHFLVRRLADEASAKRAQR